MVKRKNRQEPNIKQKKVMTTLLEDGGSVSAAMRKAGYSKAYSKNPQKLKKTLSFEELKEKNIPETLVTRKHHQLLNSKLVIVSSKTMEAVVTKYINGDDVAKGVDMAYKLRGSYPNKLEVTGKDGERLIPAPIYGGKSVGKKV